VAQGEGPEFKPQYHKKKKRKKNLDSYFIVYSKILPKFKCLSLVKVINIMIEYLNKIYDKICYVFTQNECVINLIPTAIMLGSGA
jgi:hypothetical protein